MRTGQKIKKKNFWFSIEDDNILKQKANKAGLKESPFIRKLIRESIVREKPDDRFYEVMKYMRTISNNLNQIAKKSHSLGYIDELAYKREADKWNEFMEKVKKEFLLK